MKSILIISAYPPNKKTAGQNFTNQFILDLVQRDVKVGLVYFKYGSHKVECSEDVNIIKAIDLDRNSKIKSIIKNPFIFPLFSARFNKKVAKELNEIAKKYDAVYFDFSQVFLYSRFVNHPRKIFMSHDVISQKYSRKNRILGLWAKIIEKKILKNTSELYCFSGKDKTLVKQNYNINAVVVPFYIEKNAINASCDSMGDYFVFYGAWNRSENADGLEWFITNVYPKLQKKHKFKIIGGSLSDSIKGLLNDDFEYLGFVEDPYPIIANAKALVAPIFQGAGVKVKVIEAMAVGITTIGTEIAFEGIDNFELQGYTTLNIVKDANSFATKIDSFATDILVKSQIKKHFLTKYSNDSIADKILDK